MNNLPQVTRMNKCPTLDYKNFKIIDKEMFCKFAEKRTPFETNDEHSMEYTIIKTNVQLVLLSKGETVNYLLNHTTLVSNLNFFFSQAQIMTSAFLQIILFICVL